MPFVKVIKTRAYFKRYQTKYRRRRECKTDYAARRRLVAQDQTKSNTPKYRLCVRFTNKRTIAQIIYATIQGDRIVCAATSDELTKYGMPVGHGNYAAAYATGLLVARRLLKKYDMDETFKGVENATGESYHVEEEDTERRPFKVLLDVGLVRTTSGHRVFAALKGAVDGGLYVPHNEKRFAGYNKENETLDTEKFRARIFGVHVGEYMAKLKEEDEEKYSSHFSDYIKHNIGPDNIEDKYKAVHASIRANPEHVAAKKE